MGDQAVRAIYVYDSSQSQHVLREGHPMRPVRLQRTYDLIAAYGVFDRGAALSVPPREATEEELRSFHTDAYITAVKALSGGERAHGGAFGFSDHGDNPVYPGMYEAALSSTGAAVRAAELVADGVARAAFAPAGGLHHAMANYASGFCIFNDPVIAINALRQRGLRVAYVDIDAHHGDGVQAAFYHDSDVLTISIHESGRWLFPGTGHVHEIGEGEGRGFAVNLPLYPYTDDAVYLEAFDAVVPPLIKAFAPDIIATQLGCDTYVTDPLTHLALSTNGYAAVVRRLGELGYPWVAFGGGGYDLDAVPRCWALAFAEMVGEELPDHLPEGAGQFLKSRRLRDEEAPTVDASTQEQARRFAWEQVQELRRVVFPIHGIT